MTTGKRVKEILNNREFVPAKTRLQVSPGKSLRILRELQELSQSDLATLTGFPQPTISGMEVLKS